MNRDCVLRWQAGDLRAVPVEQKLALLRSYQPLLERSGLAATRARYLDVHVDKTFRSSLGADIRQDYQHCGIALGYSVTGANARSRTVSSAMHRISRACRAARRACARPLRRT